MDKALKITDRQIAHLREEISRVHRQVQLIKQGRPDQFDKYRMDIAIFCCQEIDRLLCEL